MAKPNYQFEKRQRELEKKRKKDEKRQLALAAKDSAAGSDTDSEQEPAVVDSDVPGTVSYTHRDVYKRQGDRRRQPEHLAQVADAKEQRFW